MYFLQWIDNGSGMKQEEADKLVNYPVSGYGLKNVNDRMLLLYGERYAIRIYSKIGQGTRVEMRIPCQSADKETRDEEIFSAKKFLQSPEDNSLQTNKKER